MTKLIEQKLERLKTENPAEYAVTMLLLKALKKQATQKLQSKN